MLELRTTKQVQVSLHTEETACLCFRCHFARLRTQDIYRFNVECYKIETVPDGSESLDMVPAGNAEIPLSIPEIKSMLTAATPLIPKDLDPLDHFEALIIAGIKIYITQKGYWRNQITLKDFK